MGSGALDDRRILVDDDLERTYAEQGWVVTEPLLTPEECAELRSRLIEFIPDEPPPMFSPHRGDTLDQRIEMDRIVKEAFRGSVEKLLEPTLRHLVAGVVVKNPGEAGDLPLHRDWNYVDESRYGSALVWVALEDIDRDNGGLAAVAGSHKLGLTYRGSGPGEWPQSEEEVRDVLASYYLTPIDVPMGCACIFENSLLHASVPNLTDQPRIVAAVSVAPGAADIVHYHVDDEGRRWEYLLDPEFLLREHELTRAIGGPYILGVREVFPDLVMFGQAELDRLTPTRDLPPGPLLPEPPSTEVLSEEAAETAAHATESPMPEVSTADIDDLPIATDEAAAPPWEPEAVAAPRPGKIRPWPLRGPARLLSRLRR